MHYVFIDVLFEEMVSRACKMEVSYPQIFIHTHSVDKILFWNSFKH